MGKIYNLYILRDHTFIIVCRWGRYTTFIYRGTVHLLLSVDGEDIQALYITITVHLLLLQAKLDPYMETIKNCNK